MSKSSTIASFIESAPPGELHDVVNDIKALDSSAIDSAVFKQYNEEQLTTVKLPGASQEVLLSPYNVLEDDRYYDAESQTSFVVDHTTQKASATQSHTLESQHADLVKSIHKALSSHAKEHFPASTYGAFPVQGKDDVAILLVANKYSPNNFWNGRWRSHFLFNTASGALTGSIKVDVHYYEDGNVRLLTEKPVTGSTLSSSASGAEIVGQIAMIERKYQEDLNRGFTGMSEGAFKSLRRQLPVTRQKVEWDKISGYKIGASLQR